MIDGRQRGSLLAVGVLLMAAAHSGLAQDNGVNLASGLVVDPSGRVFLRAPDQSLVAVSAQTGLEVWSREYAGKPLNLAGDDALLICHRPSAEPDNVLRVVAVDSRTGDEKFRAEHALPAGVTAMVDNSREASFHALVSGVANEADVQWQFERTRTLALPPGTLDDLPRGGAARPPAPARRALNRGAVRIDLRDGRTADAAPTTTQPAGVRNFVEPDRVTPRASGEIEILSVDQRHTMISRKVDGSWEKYELTIRDRTGGELGSFRSHVAVTPFVVVGEVAVVEGAPYTRREQGQLIEHPRQVRGIDLKTGKVLWTREIYDDTVRGPVPP